MPFLLLWGGFLVLLTVCIALFCAAPRAWLQHSALSFGGLMIVFGLLALIAPMMFYIRGAFGDGDFRHQDTVFKFGLQAWLLLGTATTCSALSLIVELARFNRGRGFVGNSNFVRRVRLVEPQRRRRKCAAFVEQRTSFAAGRPERG